MTLQEISGQLYTYQATVRVKSSAGDLVVKTELQAAGLAQAKAILAHLFGAANVVTVA